MAMNDAYEVMDGLRRACHDIRQPIAGMLAIAGAALAEAGLPDNTRGRLEQIVELAEWQSHVIEHLLQTSGLSQPDAGHSDVVQVVNEAAAAERLAWGGELTLVWPPERVFAPMHPVILRRMTGNLLANATRAAGPSGTVTVKVRTQDSWMLLVLEDSGPGFGWVAGGPGLGLSTVAQQAARHGGRLECGRGSLGGAQVGLWLPLAKAPAGRKVTDAGCSM